MTDHDNLPAALAAFQAEMPTVSKGKTANAGSYSYTYADLADVTQAALPLLAKHGLSFSCQPQRTEQGDYELAGVLLHHSGRETGSLPIHGRTAQEIGSSITYGRRYLLGCMTGLVTDDDDDAQQATQTTARARRAPTEQERAQQALTAAQERVRAAWVAKHGSFNLDALRADYEQATAQPLDDATVDDLDSYAASLGGAK